ncbi:sulfate/anion exchanger-like protein [Leptotrombidium deliense]|uniref:Sulfate/anion exchanger-like protein n=1 Tax=Leptotrombidium deliense TaxID=299467 RepID=A0A443RWU5_9ACAR|nr:sulfate/anion exchanger-like protein [Leptotrombidium deliense]
MSRNALIVLICAIAIYISNCTVFTLTERIDAGFPPFELPPFGIYGNETFTNSMKKIATEINYGMVTSALLSLLETVAIAKALERNNHSSDGQVKQSFDASQDLVALGLTHIVHSMFGGFPVTGSFTRSAINNASGVRSTLSNMITGLTVLLALSQFVAPCFSFIPQTTLASVVIAAVIFIIKPQDISAISKYKKIDLLPYSVTLIASFAISLEVGIIAGSAVSLAMPNT